MVCPFFAVTEEASADHPETSRSGAMSVARELALPLSVRSCSFAVHLSQKPLSVWTQQTCVVTHSTPQTERGATFNRRLFITTRYLRFDNQPNPPEQHVVLSTHIDATSDNSSINSRGTRLTSPCQAVGVARIFRAAHHGNGKHGVRETSHDEEYVCQSRTSCRNHSVGISRPRPRSRAFW